MDDFGTGYSSLSYLRRFPFDKIKIDRSFIKDLAEQDGSLAIVQAVVSIAKSRDISTTAEGVETQEQLELLRGAGLHRDAGLSVQRGRSPRRRSCRCCAAAAEHLLPKRSVGLSF